jgi:ABC-type Fe3+ transport system substrate-binding protein
MDGRHPQARAASECSKLYMDFLLSPEGQGIYVKLMGWSSARSDVPAPDIKEAPADAETIKAELSLDETLKVRAGYVAKWKQLWGLGGSLPK